MHDLPSCPSTLLMRYTTMKRKHLILLTTLSLFTFSALHGCGCGTVRTSEPIQSETATVETETTSQPETETQKESPSASETAEIETAEVETETVSDETEETISKNNAIIEMDAIMYATTSVNERKEPSADSEKIGSLSIGEETHVTGLTEDGNWYRVEHSESGEGFVASQYLSSEKPVVEEESHSTSESESTSSNGGSTSSDNGTGTTQTETPPEQETVVLEPAPAEEDLPPAPAPDNPDALESLPIGGSANVGGAVDFSQMTNGSGTGMSEGTLSGGDTGLTWN